MLIYVKTILQINFQRVYFIKKIYFGLCFINMRKLFKFCKYAIFKLLLKLNIALKKAMFIKAK